MMKIMNVALGLIIVYRRDTANWKQYRPFFTMIGIFLCSVTVSESQGYRSSVTISGVFGGGAVV